MCILHSYPCFHTLNSLCVCCAEKLSLKSKCYNFQVGNFRVEPPGLFRGRGEHPKVWKLFSFLFELQQSEPLVMFMQCLIIIMHGFIVLIYMKQMGKLKKRIYPKDITINIGKDAPIPPSPIPGQRWFYFLFIFVYMYLLIKKVQLFFSWEYALICVVIWQLERSKTWQHSYLVSILEWSYQPKSLQVCYPGSK